MRRKIYEIIEVSEEREGKIYDFIIMATTILSIVSLAFRTTSPLFNYIEYISIFVFSVDYILRLITADFILNKSKLSFFIYPFTPMAIVDLLSILFPLPFLIAVGGKFISRFIGILPKTFRLLRTLKLVRLFKFIRYSSSLEIIASIFRKQKKILLAVATMAICYVLVSALIMYNVEPDHFSDFFDAVYWATITLTSVGYGDICPSTSIGKVVTIISSFFGIAIIALPSSVITAGYLSEMNDKKK